MARGLESLKNLHFNGLRLTKVHNVWPKIVQRSYLLWYWRVMKNLKKNWLVVWKITLGICQIFPKAKGSLEIKTCIGFFYPKWKMYQLIIYRGIMFHGSEEWCKISRRIDLSVQNWYKEFKFWPEHSKISQICTLVGYLWPKYIMF